jgi:hypothetical protein
MSPKGRGRPSREEVLRALDRAIDDLRSVGGLPLPVEADAIWEGIWYEEAHHSTAIEGNTLVLREVERLLGEGKAVGSKELAEYSRSRATQRRRSGCTPRRSRNVLNGPRGSEST